MEKINQRFLKGILPSAMASCSLALKHRQSKVQLVAKAHLSMSEPNLKDKFLGTRLGKLLLNPFGYQFKI